MRDIRTAAQIASYCQRNWNLHKQIDREIIDTIESVICSAPSKQNEDLYDVIIIQNRDIIEQIYSTTRHPEVGDDDPIKNPQTLANLLIVFCEKSPKQKRIPARDYSSQSVQEQTNLAIGIAAGQISLTSALQGLNTGFCHCFDRKRVCDILDCENPSLILGVGFADSTKLRTEHHLLKNYFFNSFDKEIQIKKIDSKNVTKNFPALDNYWTCEFTYQSKENKFHLEQILAKYLDHQELELIGNSVREAKTRFGIIERKTKFGFRYYAPNKINLDKFIYTVESTENFSLIESRCKENGIFFNLTKNL